MSDQYETPTSRIIVLGLAFAALVAIGVVTVLKPELEQEPEAANVAEVGPQTAPSPPQTPAP